MRICALNNKTDYPLAKLTIKIREKSQIINIKNEREGISKACTGTEKIIKEYHELFFPIKFTI